MDQPVNLADLRKEYSLKDLDITDVADNPFDQFRQWFTEALQATVNEPNAMHLATVSAEGRPSGRVVLLKDLTPEGEFTFYTNYSSRKGEELAHNPWASLTFFWPELERQIRIEGKTTRVTDQTSDAYFSSRPRGSQIGAWTSPQSKVIQDRNHLAEKQRQVEVQFTGQAVPRPGYWGGYRLQPDRIEFWQGRPSRLHDRILYLQGPDGQWTRQRLAP
jgi:pyridoxamine 5'-phosphate oxidase